jgi:hypothetical protein
MISIAIAIIFCGLIAGRCCTYYCQEFKCKHTWKRFQRVAVKGNKEGTITGYEYHLECTKCGDVKTSKI